MRLAVINLFCEANHLDSVSAGGSTFSRPAEILRWERPKSRQFCEIEYLNMDGAAGI